MFLHTTLVSGITTSLWLLFWFFWLIMAGDTHLNRATRHRLTLMVIYAVAVSGFNPPWTAIHVRLVVFIGLLLFLSGLQLAIVARLCLGSNWGPARSEREDRKLIESGPYLFVRHPIYSGILLAMVGTALATNLVWLLMILPIGRFMVGAAGDEERMLIQELPDYRNYQARTKRLIPGVW